MTRDEKFKAIIGRLGESAIEFQPIHLSVLILMGYMEILFENGIIYEGTIEITPAGKQAMVLCQEFDWKPTDADVVTFCKEMVTSEQLESFVLMLRAMRDDRETFLENAKKHVGY